MATKSTPCKACNGSGKMYARKVPKIVRLEDPVDADAPPLSAILETRTCPHCGGSGWLGHVQAKK